ncbi:MAG: exodeoxyribonuclease VII large subunit [Bacteroidetes bacterium]|nr:exodeoxyribonuclease VII large subunit [Bacteroidota bacterium]
MPERTVYTLSKILKGIRDYLETRIKGKTFWLKVEIADLKYHKTGHCYLELTESTNGQNIAQCKGAIWQSNLSTIRANIGEDFDNIVKKGNEIVCLVELSFSERYGLNIIIKDIDITFNLGELEKRKQETINRLTKENLLGKNKENPLPTVIQKIGIIASPETAGITDLLKQLKNNSYQYVFDIEVFSCSVQGDKAQAEIISRLQQLKNSRFEVICLIRGGGSKLDLDVFNSYEIAREIALHDKPIFTGIGHETDLCVADLVANVYHKTPTALGSYIVDRARNFEVRFVSTFNYILEYKDKFLESRRSALNLNISTFSSRSITYTQLRRGELHTKMTRIIPEVINLINIQKNSIGISREVLRTIPRSCLTAQSHLLNTTIQLVDINSQKHIKSGLMFLQNNFELILSLAQSRISESTNYIQNIIQVIGIYHPDDILLKGYGIPRKDGILLSKQELHPDDTIELELSNRVLVLSFVRETQIFRTK